MIPEAKFPRVPCNESPMAKPAAARIAAKDVVSIPNFPSAAKMTKIIKAI